MDGLKPSRNGDLFVVRLYVVRTVFGLVIRAIENSVDLFRQHNRAIRVLAGGASCSHSDA
jgi:hypothetical protein